jgi:hypothetical protein
VNPRRPELSSSAESRILARPDRYLEADRERERDFDSTGERVYGWVMAMLAGLPVDDRLVLELARRLHDAGFDDEAATLEDAYDAERAVVALTIAEREAILRVLEDCPEELAELRGVLLREHEWRMREGL